MAKITPFRGLRPVQELAQEVATLPYDVVNVEEARAYKDEPYHFYHVTRSHHKNREKAVLSFHPRHGNIRSSGCGLLFLPGC